MDKEGRLVLLTDNLKRFINNSKTLLFALFFLGVLDASSQEYENNSIDGGKHAEWKTFTKAGEPGNEPDIEGSASGVLLKQLTPGAIVTSAGKNIAPATLEVAMNQSKFIQQSLIIGDQRNFISALIVPSFDNVNDYLLTLDKEKLSNEAMVDHHDVLTLFDNEIQKIMSKFSQFSCYIIIS